MSAPTHRSSWPRAILHLDMDAFYANVHLLDNPADRELPLAIGGRPDQRGVVASASYEARKFGIRSAMPMSRAVRLCHNLKIVPPNWPRIRECSAQIMAILQRYGPLEKMSVDEAYVDLSAHANPQTLATEIQTAVKQESHLPASVGLATSKLVAKVASDFDKPAGHTVVLPGTEAAFLADLPVRVIWGIGPKTAAKLAAVQIQTCAQLAAANYALLKPILGNQTRDVQERARGIDGRPVQAWQGPPKSISQEWTFNNDIADATTLQKKLHDMCQVVAGSLQKRNLVARTVSVKIRWADFTTFTRQKSVEVGLHEAEDIYRLAEMLWADNWGNRPLRLLGVGVSNLEEPQVKQLGFDFG